MNNIILDELKLNFTFTEYYSSNIIIYRKVYFSNKMKCLLYIFLYLPLTTGKESFTRPTLSLILLFSSKRDKYCYIHFYKFF